MLSTILSGSKVSVLVNDGPEPETEEIVTLASLLDKHVVPLSQVTSASEIETSVSVALLMEMVQVRVRGVIVQQTVDQEEQRCPHWEWRLELIGNRI